MRTYGRLNGTWQVVETTEDGYNDMVYATTLLQCLKLFLGESPFYAQYGIPAQTSVVQQVFPDFDTVKTQLQFAPFFANLIITRVPAATPTYRVNLTTNQGFRLNEQVSQ